jgi:hypothetical protein
MLIDYQYRIRIVGEKQKQKKHTGVIETTYSDSISHCNELSDTSDKQIPRNGGTSFDVDDDDGMVKLYMYSTTIDDDDDGSKATKSLISIVGVNITIYVPEINCVVVDDITSSLDVVVTSVVVVVVLYICPVQHDNCSNNVMKQVKVTTYGTFN